MSPSPGLNGLQTEERNPRSADIDNVSTVELCQIMNDEDGTIASTIKACLPTIASAIDALAPRVLNGGRVIYVGAGTSGRLGVLDASEIPPTFSVSPDQFVGLIAGGDTALRSSKEGAEDSLEAAVNDLESLNLDGNHDSLIGIAASGRTPYVLSSLAFAKSKGCVSIGLACSTPSAMRECGNVDFMIEAVTGPEVVTGSTRMKAGTATKLVLNMLSTGVMIRVGKTFGNIMVDVKPTNVKLQLRARRILGEICGDRAPESDEELDGVLEACGKSVKLAAAKLCLNVSVEEAEVQLQKVDGVLATLLKEPKAVSGVEKGEDTKYVLCVDGGGSKCTAVIMSSTGAVGAGEAGPCNPSEIGVQAAVAAIKIAIQMALDWLPSPQDEDIRNVKLAEAWIGFAGFDREGLDSRIRFEMTKLLGSRPNMKLSVSNDLELLASIAGHKFAADNVTVLIAGTGSIAIRYEWQDGRFQKARRAGGWGALLGDDGSGFDIGRQAIRHCLRRREEKKELHRILKPALKRPDQLPGMILDHFHPPDAEENVNSYDLLSSVLLAGSQDAQTASQTKRRIASCAKVVLEALPFRSELARDIVQSAIHSLVDLVASVNQSRDPNDDDSVLVIAGGLIQSPAFRAHLESKLAGSSAPRRIEWIDNPAYTGAHFLADRVWGSRGNS